MALFLTGKKIITNQNEIWRIGNAQMIGSREIQSNYFSTVQGEDVFAVLADGTIDHINGRYAAILAVETCMSEFFKKPEQIEIPEFFEFLSFRMSCNIREHIYMGKTPHVSVSMVYGKGEKFYYYNVGANQIFVFDGKDYLCLKEQNGLYDRKPTDTIGLISEGVYQILNEKELIHSITELIDTFEKAQNIRLKINEKKKRQRKNATIILIEGRL